MAKRLLLKVVKLTLRASSDIRRNERKGYNERDAGNSAPVKWDTSEIDVYSGSKREPYR